MREGLGEVARHAAGFDVVLLRHQTQVVAQLEQPLEQRSRVVDPAQQHIGVGQPETAGQEGSLARRQAVRHLGGVVAHEQAVRGHQLALDRLDRRHEDGVVGLDEAHLGQEQQAGVEIGVVVGALEDATLFVDALVHDVGPDRLA